MPLKVSAEWQSTEAEKRSQDTKHYQNLGLQGLLTLGTWLAFFAAAYYASIAKRQLEASNATLCEIQKQSKLMRQQTIGVFGASITIESPRPISFFTDPGLLKLQGVNVFFVNLGKVDAIGFHATATMSRLSLPGFKQIGSPVSNSVDAPRLRPFEQYPPNIPGFSSDDLYIRLTTASFTIKNLNTIGVMKEAVQIEGVTTYDNGFQEIDHRPFCFMYTRIPTRDSTGKILPGTDGTWSTCRDKRAYIEENEANEKAGYPVSVTPP